MATLELATTSTCNCFSLRVSSVAGVLTSSSIQCRADSILWSRRCIASRQWCTYLNVALIIWAVGSSYTLIRSNGWINWSIPADAVVRHQGALYYYSPKSSFTGEQNRTSPWITYLTSLSIQRILKMTNICGCINWSHRKSIIDSGKPSKESRRYIDVFNHWTLHFLGYITN